MPVPRSTFVALALALGVTWHVWADPAWRVLGRPEGEMRDHLAIAWLVADRVNADGALPLFFEKANFPRGLSLYPLDPLNQLALTALAPWIGLVPALALLTVALLVLVGVGAGRFARALGASPAGALAATALTMLGPPVLGSFADTQTEGMGIGWMLLLGAEIAAPPPWTRGRALRAGLFGAALIASAPYQAHGVGILAAAAFAWRARSARLVLVAALPVVLCGVPLGLAMWQAEGGQGGQLADRVGYDDGWPPRTQVRGVDVAPDPEGVSPSFPVTIGAWERTPSRAPPATGPRRHAGYVLPILALLAVGRPRARLLLLGAAGYTALAVGSARELGEATVVAGGRIPLPYDLFYRWYPLGELAWKPAQYAVPAWCLAVAAASLLPGRVVVVGALAVAIELQVLGPTPLPFPAVDVRPLPVHEDLGSAGAVLEFPCRARSRAGRDMLPNDALLGLLVHGRPIAESFNRGRNIVADELLDAMAGELRWAVREPRDLEAMWKRAAAAGYSWLVVHGGTLSAEERERLDRAIRPLARDRRDYPDGVMLYGMKPP